MALDKEIPSPDPLSPRLFFSCSSPPSPALAIDLLYSLPDFIFAGRVFLETDLSLILSPFPPRQNCWIATANTLSGFISSILTVPSLVSAALSYLRTLFSLYFLKVVCCFIRIPLFFPIMSFFCECPCDRAYFPIVFPPPPPFRSFFSILRMLYLSRAFFQFPSFQFFSSRRSFVVLSCNPPPQTPLFMIDSVFSLFSLLL